MKYLLLCAVAFIVIFGIGYLFSRLLLRKSSSPRKGIKTAGLTVLIGLLIIVLAFLGYASIYYRAGETALTAMEGSSDVTVSETDGGYFFDGPGTGTALIFYPGAKVECRSYAPLMLKLAEGGIDCFLADMPFNFAFFGSNIADRFFKNHSYGTTLIAGHSLGGVVATSYALGHSEDIDGIVLLASYPTAAIGDRFALLSIYGTEDGCLARAGYEAGRIFWPATAKEVVIEGGNHAGFADYGAQKGDGTASLTNEEQQRLTTNAILDFWK